MEKREKGRERESEQSVKWLSNGIVRAFARWLLFIFHFACAHKYSFRTDGFMVGHVTADCSGSRVTHTRRLPVEALNKQRDT